MEKKEVPREEKSQESSSPSKRRIVIINNYRNKDHLTHLEDTVNQQLQEIKKENKDFNYKVVVHNNYEYGLKGLKKKIKKDTVIISSGGNKTGTKSGNYVKIGDELHRHIKKKLKDNYVLGVCQGAQALGEAYGGNLTNSGKSHTKRRPIKEDQIKSDNHLFESNTKNTYHANHKYYIKTEDKGELQPIAISESEHDEKVKFIDAYKVGKHYGTQFHPERTKRGKDFLKNFLYMAAGYSK